MTDGKDHHLLVSELQALVIEAKRRHPDVKDVSDSHLTSLCIRLRVGWRASTGDIEEWSSFERDLASYVRSLIHG